MNENFISVEDQVDYKRYRYCDYPCAIEEHILGSFYLVGAFVKNPCNEIRKS